MGNSGSAQEISRVVGIVPTKITAFVILILILILVPVLLRLVFVVLVLILVPILLRQIIAGGAARTPERAPLVSTKAGIHSPRVWPATATNRAPRLPNILR